MLPMEGFEQTQSRYWTTYNTGMPPIDGGEQTQSHHSMYNTGRNNSQFFNFAPPPTSSQPAPHGHNNFSNIFKVRALAQTPLPPAPIYTPLPPPPPPGRAPPHSPRLSAIPTTPPTLLKPVAFDHSRPEPPAFDLNTKLRGVRKAFEASYRCQRVLGMQDPKPFLRPPFVPRGFFGRVGEVWRDQARERNGGMDFDMDDDIYMQRHMREGLFGRMRPAHCSPDGVEKSQDNKAEKRNGGYKIHTSYPSSSASSDWEAGAVGTEDKPEENDDSKARRVLGLTGPAPNPPHTTKSSSRQNIPSKRSPSSPASPTGQLKRGRSIHFFKTTLSSSMPLLRPSGNTTTNNPPPTRKRPIYTRGLSHSLLTWHVAMWNVWNVYKPTAEQMKLHPLFASYPPVHTLNLKCVSFSFRDTSTEPHRQLYFVGPGDFDELLYAEVDTFALDQAHKEKMLEGRWAFVVLQNNPVGGEAQSSAQPAPPAQQQADRVEKKKPRYQWLMIAWPVSAVTKTSQCIQCLYPDACTTTTTTTTPSSPLDQSAPTPPQPGEMIALNRTTYLFGKAGGLPLVESNGVDVQIVEGFVGAVGRGAGKLMVYTERA